MAHILIVEDEPQLRYLLRHALKRAGHEVTEAADGRRAIAAQRERHADLVISDLFMPDMDGMETIRLLRAEFPDIKIIAVSGGGFGGTMDLLPVARMMGAVAAFHKPFTLKEMVAAVEKALVVPAA